MVDHTYLSIKLKKFVCYTKGKFNANVGLLHQGKVLCQLSLPCCTAREAFMLIIMTYNHLVYKFSTKHTLHKGEILHQRQQLP